MLPKKDRVRLQHILDAANEATESARGRSVADLAIDRPFWHTLVHCLETIGEAAAQVSAESRGELPQLPWTKMIGIRNRLIHVYFDINSATIWQTVTDDLPPLIAELEKVLPPELF
jgi:uncharacterized protein with HEPN domain